MDPDWYFWFLGAAFILIEFTSITRLALLFGTTWLVNALSIFGVLLMTLAAKLSVLRTTRLNQKINYFFLFISLIFIFFFPLDELNQLSFVWHSILSILVLSIPLFLSGLIFAESLRRSSSASGPLASNLSDSVFGGVLEYSALWWGMRSLYLVAIVVYGFAFVFFIRQE